MSEQPAERAVKPRKPGLLQRMWGFDSRHPLWWDLGPPAIVGLALLVGIAAMGLGAAESWYVALIVVLFLVPMRWRRRRPFAVYLSQLVPMLLIFLADYRITGEWRPVPVDIAAVFAFVPVLFNVALRCRARLVWAAAVLTAVQTALELWLTSAGSSAGDGLRRSPARP
ncbi:hypothetical protein GCM10029992_46000 [Glycomyces albus]